MRAPYWELSNLGGPRVPPAVVLGRKYCPGCGRWRHVCDFAPHRGRPRSRCRVCVRAYQRRWHANATPEQRERIREYYRIWADAKRRERGVPYRQFHHRKPRAVDREFYLLDPAPLVAEIDAYVERFGETALGELSARSGVSQRRIWSLRHHEYEHVTVDSADRLSIAMGVPFPLLYDEDAATYLRPQPGTHIEEVAA